MEHDYIGTRIYRKDWLYMQSLKKRHETLADVFEKVIESHKNLINPAEKV